ncbi:MAG: FAD/NAD(P)-binding protein [Cyanobacteria bacterium HKST-UBA02]|nr:FAD/NAD(P)-binding protein [Cyanobacteria bacterium HKST-UBA02]
MLEWLIVGGGIHGTYLANLLIQRFKIPHDRLMIVDPHDSPCQSWKVLTERTGMVFLRSTMERHLDVDPDSLKKFLASDTSCPEPKTLGDGLKPSLALFNAHIDHVIDKAELHKSYRVGRVKGITVRSRHIVAHTSFGDVKTRRVILAMSPTENPEVPAWAHALQEKGLPVRHVFDETFTRRSIAPGFTYAIVGRGLTAAQVALIAAEKSPGKAYLLSKGQIPVHDIGFRPATELGDFHGETDMAKRREYLSKAMVRGSITREVAADLFQASMVDRHLKVSFSHAVDGKALDNGQIELTLSNGESLVVDRVLLGTGFNIHCPGEDWLKGSVYGCDLPVHTDGYPIVDKFLRWHPRIFVTGALAELEIGPGARNIVGARLAGDRIANWLEGQGKRK